MVDFELLRNTLRDQLRPRKMAATAILVALPALMALFWRMAGRGEFKPETVYNVLAGLLVFGFSLVILAVIFAPTTVSQELEDKTIVYLLTRPVPRWRILLAKFAGTLAVIWLTCWLASLILALVAYGPAKLGQAPLVRDMGMLALGGLAYGAIFLLFATFTRRPLIYGLLYAFGWEALAAILPGEFKKTSLMLYLRVLAPHPMEAARGRGFEWLLQTINPAGVRPWVAWLVLGGVTFAALAASVVIFSEREYAPREDVE